MSPQRRLEWMVLVVVLGFFAAAAVIYVNGQYRGLGYPADTFLFKANDAYTVDDSSPPPRIIGDHRFGDFYDSWENARRADPYRWIQGRIVPPSSYFPATHTLLNPLMRLPLKPALAVFLLSVVAGLLTVVWRALPRDSLPLRLLGTLVLGLMSFPVLFALDRGNIEPLLFLGAAGALFAYRARRYYLAAVLIALPIAAKGAAAVFLLPFLLARRWRALCVALASVVGLTLGSLLILKGSFAENIDGLRASLSAISSVNGSGDLAAQHGASLKSLYVSFAHWHSGLGWLVDGYLVSVAVLAIGVLLACSLLPLYCWQQVAALVVVSLLVPSVSKDYRLMYVLLPTLLFIREERVTSVDGVSLLMMGLLLVPKPAPVLWDDVTIGSVVNPLLLLGLLGAVCFDGAVRYRRGDRGSLSA